MDCSDFGLSTIIKMTTSPHCLARLIASATSDRPWAKIPRPSDTVSNNLCDVSPLVICDVTNDLRNFVIKTASKVHQNCIIGLVFTSAHNLAFPPYSSIVVQMYNSPPTVRRRRRSSRRQSLESFRSPRQSERDSSF